MLLPHGFEGQGADHSSARLERFLTLSADNNLRVVYPSTAAQYFHVLRRQARTPRRVPLVCLTPKRYLRLAHTRSPIEAFTHDHFHPVLGDRSPDLDADEVKRVVVCSGKVGHELMDARDRAHAPLAVLRVEELRRSPETSSRPRSTATRTPTQVWWVQEEPLNMGAGTTSRIRSTSWSPRTRPSTTWRASPAPARRRAARRSTNSSSRRCSRRR